jgi:hypothetical protein
VYRNPQLTAVEKLKVVWLKQLSAVDYCTRA